MSKRQRLEALHKKVAAMSGEVSTILTGARGMPVLSRSMLIAWSNLLSGCVLEIDKLLEEDRKRKETSK